MLKVDVDMKNGKIDVECKGSARALAGEIFSIMGYIYSNALAEEKLNFAEDFRGFCSKISHPLLNETVFERNPWFEETMEIVKDESEQQSNTDV